MTEEQVEGIVATIAGRWTRPRMTPEDRALYADELQDLPYEAMVLGVRELIRSSKYLPTIAEFRKAAKAADRTSSEGSIWKQTPRMERLIQLRSQAENTALSQDERQDALDRASEMQPGDDEWHEARRIADQRWQERVERCRAKQEAEPRPRPPERFPDPPRHRRPPRSLPPAESQARVAAILAIVGGGPGSQKQTDVSKTHVAPMRPAVFVKEDQTEVGERYRYYVWLEQCRRAWMRAKGFVWTKRLPVWTGDVLEGEGERDAVVSLPPSADFFTEVSQHGAP